MSNIQVWRYIQDKRNFLLFNLYFWKLLCRYNLYYFCFYDYNNKCKFKYLYLYKLFEWRKSKEKKMKT